MGTGASSVKPQSHTTEIVENRSCVGSTDGREPDRDKNDNFASKAERKESDAQPHKNIKPSPFSISDTGLRRQSKGSEGVLPPIKKQGSTTVTSSSVVSLKPSNGKEVSAKNMPVSERIAQLELELAKSESDRLDAEDQIRLLESRLSGIAVKAPTKQDNTQMNETIHAKDQYIVKLEKDLKLAQVESNTMRLKLKKRIKGLTNQLHEVRQEASITQMELRQEISQNKDTIKDMSTSGSGGSPSAEDGHASAGNSKVIVELSTQLSEQEERISSLETQIVEKDLFIERLQSQLKDVLEGGTNPTIQDSKPVQGDRLRSGRGSRYQSSSKPPSTSGNARTDSKMSSTWQSTALSDSDSDWDTSELTAHIHSAPARVRVKSAQSVQSTDKKAILGGSLQSEDDSIMQYLNNENDPHSGKTNSNQRVKPHKKSALKNHLEKRRFENEMSALMGPSLAFESHKKEPPSDTSCEPTPRNTDPSNLPGFSKLTVVQPAHL